MIIVFVALQKFFDELGKACKREVFIHKIRKSTDTNGTPMHIVPYPEYHVMKVFSITVTMETHWYSNKLHCLNINGLSGIRKLNDKRRNRGRSAYRH